MEKKHKSFTMGTQRQQRKAFLKAATSEPKDLIFDIADIPPIKLAPLSAASTRKTTNIAQSIILEHTDSEVISSKNKIEISSENIESDETTPHGVKKAKKRKRLSENKAKGRAISPRLKKKRKEKKLMAEVHNLKVELGIADATNRITMEKTDDVIEPKTPISKLVSTDMHMHESDKYPIMKDKGLIEKFLKVPMTNNQKGRIRQALKLTLQGSTAKMFPDIINAKIQAILKSSTDLTESELRRVRILYNMLKTAIDKPEELEEIKPPKQKKDKKKKGKNDDKDEEGKKNVAEPKKVKGPKRYVVFLGNLPLSVNKDKIMEHFREFNEHIVDIRLPKRAPDKKSAIAYVELSNEPSYELALSKHHSMMGTKRIKVLYTTQKKGKISKAHAKSKSAKLIALQKAGKLVGSIPKTKKRSHRRAIMKQAKAKEAAATE